MAAGLDVKSWICSNGRSLPTNSLLQCQSRLILVLTLRWALVFQWCLAKDLLGWWTFTWIHSKQGQELKGRMCIFHNHLFLFILQENLRTYETDRWWHFLAGLLGPFYKAAFHLSSTKVITWFPKEMLIAIHLAHTPFLVWNSNELTLLFLCKGNGFTYVYLLLNSFTVYIFCTLFT